MEDFGWSLLLLFFVSALVYLCLMNKDALMWSPFDLSSVILEIISFISRFSILYFYSQVAIIMLLAHSNKEVSWYYNYIHKHSKVWEYYFILKFLILTKAEFIWSKYSKNNNIVKSYNLKYLFCCFQRS